MSYNETDSTQLVRLSSSAINVIILIATLLLLEISFLSSVLFVITLGIVSRLGESVSSSVGYRHVGPGIGLIVGGGCIVFGVQLMLLLSFPTQIAHFTALSLAGIGSLLLMRFCSDCRRPGATQDKLLLTVSIALIVFSFRHPWSIPFALAVAAAERFALHLNRRPRDRILSTLLVVSMWLLSKSLRPDRWWYFYQNNDSQFFEAIGYSGAHWGVGEHPGFAGGSIAAYHWFAYVFIGNLSHLSFLEPWQGSMMTGSGLAIFIMTSTLLGGGFSSKMQGFSPSWSILLLGVFVVSSPVFDSNLFGIVVANACILLAIRASRESVWKLVLYWTLLSTVLIFAKASTALLVFVILLIHRLFNRHPKHDQLLICILGANAILWYATIFRESRAVSALTWSFVPLQEIPSSLYQVIGRLFSPLLIGLFVICLCLTLKSTWRRLPAHIYSLLVAATGGTLILAMLQSSTFEVSYLVSPTISLLVLFVVLVVIDDQKIWLTSALQLRFIVAIALLVCGYIMGVYAPRGVARIENSLSVSAGVDFTDFIDGPLYIFAITAVIGTAVLARISRESIRVLGVVALMGAGVSAGIELEAYQETVAKGADAFTNWRGGNSAQFPDNDLRRLGKWVRDNTDESIVLASNNFCCEGSDWWLAILDAGSRYSVDSSQDTLGVENSWGGENYHLPAETRRRFWIQGLGFQTGYRPASPEQMRRVTLSLEFANQPTQAVTDQLKSGGVSGFVVNLALTQHRDWSQFAEERFRFGNFAYLELH